MARTRGPPGLGMTHIMYLGLHVTHGMRSMIMCVIGTETPESILRNGGDSVLMKLSVLGRDSTLGLLLVYSNKPLARRPPTYMNT